MRYWVMKTEPETFSIDDLKHRDEELWDGVRNYSVRNFFRDDMSVGDRAFLYHSSTKVVGIAGEMEVVNKAIPDPTQFDPASQYYDRQSKPDNPRWLAPRVRFVCAYNEVVLLSVLRTIPILESSPLLQAGNRLSVIPLSKAQWEAVRTVATGHM